LAGQASWLGQDLWVGYVYSPNPTVTYPNFDRIMVQGKRVHSGAAAVKFDATGHAVPASDTIVLSRGQFVPLVLPLLQMDVDLYLESAPTPSEKWTIELQAGLFGAYITTLDFLADGSIQARDYYMGATVVLNAPFPRDAWSHLRLVADSAVEVLTFILDGVPIGQIRIAPYGAFAELDVFNTGRGDDALYFDNLRIMNHDGSGCYPDCNEDGVLTVADFGCFQTKFVLGDPSADCNADGSLTVADFGCFQTRFVAGCP
jgi:hypothetical protein